MAYKKWNSLTGQGLVQQTGVSIPNLSKPWEIKKTCELKTFREHQTPVWSLPLGNLNLAYPLEAALWLASGITLAGVQF